MKKETIEEAIKRFNDESENPYNITDDLIKVVNWQKENFNVEELKFIYKIISFYWVQCNNEHEDNLKDFELSKSVLNKLKK